MKNKYLKHARVSEREFRSILELFCADVEALKVSRLAKVNKNTTHRLYGLLRRRVVELAHKKTARDLATRGRWDFRETFYLVSSRAAWAAARRATGTRNGEQLT